MERERGRGLGPGLFPVGACVCAPGPGSLSHQRLCRLGSLWTPLNEASAGSETRTGKSMTFPPWSCLSALVLSGAERPVFVESEAQSHTAVWP